MTTNAILQEHHHASDALRATQEPLLTALRETTRAALEAIDRTTARAARRARDATRALRAALAHDARFLLDDDGYQAFRASLRPHDATWRSAATGGLASLRQPEMRVAFEGYRRAVEEEYNDEEYFLVRQATTRVTVGAASGEVSAWLARRFVANERFVRLAPSLERLPHSLENLVEEALTRGSSPRDDVPGTRAIDYARIDELHQ